MIERLSESKAMRIQEFRPLLLPPRIWAILFARVVLGLIFFMAGVWKVFQLGPLQHARLFFVEPYAHTFLPRWSLWATGSTVPVVELVAGALLLVGWRTCEALVALGGVLVLVTFCCLSRCTSSTPT